MHFEYDLLAKDDLRLYGQGWEPETSFQAFVCLVHGLGEHSGRYNYVAEALNQAGFAFLSFDLRGHGKSPGKRGDAPSFDAFMQDIGSLLAYASQRYGQKTGFLYGHSLGGLLVLNFVLRCQPKLAGVVVTDPGLRTSLTQQKLKIAFARMMGAVLPTMQISTGLDPDMLSRDPNLVQSYRADPLVHYLSTLRMANFTLESIPWVFEHASQFNLPLLFMHGTGDQLTFPEGCQEFAKKTFCDCTVKLWDGLYHEIHNEPQKDEVLKYMIDWMKRLI
jgi:alpha-beta hydrolase superfamily lysophospholipase